MKLYRAICALVLAAALTAQAAAVRVAIVDTGASAAQMPRVVAGNNYILPADDTTDRIGHGTAVTGIILSQSPAAEAVELVWCSTGADGKTVKGNTAMAAQAIYDAVDVYGCRVINLSSGSANGSQTLQDAVAYAEKKNVVVVSAAGNDNKKYPDTVCFPAGYDTVLCVGAANETLTDAADFSQHGKVDLLAAGENITVATMDGGTEKGSGTSYATPFVAAAAANLLDACPELTAAQVRRLLTATARDVGASGYDTACGYGVVQVDAALRAAAADFADVPAGSYYADAVRWASRSAVTSGTAERAFSPNALCTRGQTVTFLWRAAGSPAPQSQACPFGDVPQESYCYEAACWAAENGIAGGTGEGVFSPDAPVTRAQALTFLCRAVGGKVAAGASFADVPADAYYASAASWGAENGVAKGTDETHFSPDAPCTRAQIVTFLYRACEKAE